MIELRQLTRHFGDTIAVNHISLTVNAGELFGFLGTNGAGKTTTMRMMVGLLKPSSGQALINGYDIQTEPMRAKRCFGYLAQEPFLYDKLTGREFLHFLGGLHRLSQDEITTRSTILLADVALTDKADELIGSYSGGMKRKIALCGALLHQPDVLILDEPFAGLDPLSARDVKQRLQDLCERGKTIFMSTHTLEIAERVCTRLGIIHQGNLRAVGRLEDLRGTQQNNTLEDIFIQLTGDQQVAGLVEVL